MSSRSKSGGRENDPEGERPIVARAIKMGFTPRAGLSDKAIELQIEIYREFHKAGIRVGMKVITKLYGPSEIVEIFPGTQRAIVLIQQSGAKRPVSFQDLRTDLAEMRRDRRHGV